MRDEFGNLVSEAEIIFERITHRNAQIDAIMRKAQYLQDLNRADLSRVNEISAKLTAKEPA